ncbi:MAG: hypothetical protein QM604_03040, partial [Microbacterium sp.]
VEDADEARDAWRAARERAVLVRPTPSGLDALLAESPGRASPERGRTLRQALGLARPASVYASGGRA